MNFLKKYQKEIALILYLIAIFSMAFTFSIERINVSDYVSINGDFQSYNVFRRILDGQTMYVDFSNYIGIAPVVINLPFLVFFNTFTGSLFITNFTSLLVFCTVVTILFYLITKNLYVSFAVSAFLPKFISSQILLRVLGPTYGFIYTQRFTDLFTPSNSMRSIRSFLPVLLIILYFIFKKLSKNKYDLLLLLKNNKFIFILGIVQGVFILWSNDFGFGVIGAVTIILIAMQLFYYKEKFIIFIKRFSFYIAGIFIGLFFITTLITKGQPLVWLQSVINTSEYQFFYFSGGGNLLPYIFSNTVLLAYTFLFICFLLYFLYKLMKKQVTESDILLVFIILSILAATYIYILGGSGYNLREPLEVYLILFVVAFLIKFIFKLLNSKINLINGLIAVFLGLLSIYYLYQAVSFQPNHQGAYSPQLGGYTTFDKAIFKASDYVGDKSVFSLYSTGLEVQLNTFNPTGYDYIIHALGDDTQKEYVEIFKNEDFDFVQTPRMDLGIWLANQNWYFFREMIYNYEKDFQTEYSWIWKKADIDEVEADVEYTLNRLSDSSIEIICTSDNTDDFIAEFQITYTTEFENAWYSFLTLSRKAAFLNTNITFDKDVSSGIALPDESTQYMPIKMQNGKGIATLSGVYGDGIKIDILDIEFSRNYPPLYVIE